MISSSSAPWRRLLPADRWDRATVAVLMLAGALIAATFRDYGSTWDERFQREVGEAAVAWWTSGGADGRALQGGSTGNLNLYGGLYEGLEELAASAFPFHPLESRHLVNAILALIGLAGAAMLGRRLGGARAGLFSAVLLVTTPTWWGHGFANSKDVPFAAPFPWLLLALLRFADELPRSSLRRVLAAGGALGACLAGRPGGLLLLVPLGASIVAARAVPVVIAVREARGRAVLGLAVRSAAALAVAWALMVVAWPYGLRHPLSGPLEAIHQAQTHPWGGLVRFAGRWALATDLPRSYAPTWLAATLPESWLAIAAIGLAACVLALVAWRRAGGAVAVGVAPLDRALVAAAGFGPVLAAVVMRPVMYDGIRHLLFILPALAALGGWVLSASLARLPSAWGRAALAVTGALAALAAVDAVRLHPYQYVYFNRAVAGGLAGAARDFELDYWSATGREGMAWLVANLPPGRTFSVATTADATVASSWLSRRDSARFLFEPPGQPDLRLATTRWFDHRSSGRVLHVVSRMGVPLLYVLDATPRSDRLVLEGGDAAVSLSPTSGWTAEPIVEPGPDRAAFTLRRTIGAPAEAQVELLRARDGPVPDVGELRAEVARRAGALLGVPPAAIEPQPVAGPSSRGWVVTTEGAASKGGVVMAVGACRVGDAAVVVRARYPLGGLGASRELLEWIRGARPADREDRRPP